MIAGRAFTVYVGHDTREKVATDVCEASMLEHSTVPLAIHRLSEPALRHNGLYNREWELKDGLKVDKRDRKPFSTAFAFSRFLVPALMQNRGWALFCDGDFLWLRDVGDLLEHFDDRYAVMVVKRQMDVEYGLKMDGQSQQPYHRKQWSSLILWNAGHASNQRITPWRVNAMSGQWLHGFEWLEDDEIGELPPLWNWLSGIDRQPANGDPYAVHFTKGHPEMPGYQGSPYAEHWRKVKNKL